MMLALDQNTYTWPLFMAWASLQYGSWFQDPVSRKREGNRERQREQENQAEDMLTFMT